MIFVFKRYKYNNNRISISKNFSFLPIISFIVTRPFKSIVKNKSNENSFDINLLKDILNKKRLIATFKTFKKKLIKEFNFIDIIEINISIYYYLTRNKENKLFSLIINEIYDTLYKPSSLKTMQKDNRISFNKSCLYDFEIKYKKCYKSYILKIV